jgi:hypothetical protein
MPKCGDARANVQPCGAFQLDCSDSADLFLAVAATIDRSKIRIIK